MAMSAATMQSGLAGMAPTSSEATAAASLASAYGTYAAGAAAGGIPLATVTVSAAQSAMQAALAGMSASGVAAATIAAAVTQFWTTALSVPSAAFTGATACTPPTGLSTLAADLTATFSSNQAGNKTLAQAAAALAPKFHAASQGATATFPGTPPVTVTVL